MIVAQYINPEETTIEVTIDGVSSYITRDAEGLLASRDSTTAETLKQWLEEGNKPFPYYNSGG